MTIATACKIVFRLDATSDIGSGHAMRCIAIAQAISGFGGNSVFAVSCSESAEFLSSKGYDTVVLGGNSLELGTADAVTLSKVCADIGAGALFIDSYGISEEFFGGLQFLREKGIRVGYLDDLYTFSTGVQDFPLKWPVDFVLNYSLYADETKYSSAYNETETKLLLGPGYVPLRHEYWSLTTVTPRKDVCNVLVTSGATNPKGFLERMSLLACKAFPSAVVHVVVGPKASFSAPCASLDIIGPQQSLLSLMKRCDVCITAAGTTLYELSAVGMPTLAVSIVDNQIDNAIAFGCLGLGFGHAVVDTDEEILRDMLALNDINVRQRFAERMQVTVGGNGAMKIARALLGD